MEPGREALELAMDDLDPLGMSQSLDPCLGMPPLGPGAPLAYPYPLDFMGLPQEAHLGENSDTPSGKEMRFGLPWDIGCIASQAGLRSRCVATHKWQWSSIALSQNEQIDSGFPSLIGQGLQDYRTPHLQEAIERR